MGILWNKEMEFLYDRVEDSMIFMEIEDEAFKVQVNKDQCQFRIYDY